MGAWRPVLFPEHNFVISGPIDLKLSTCVCCTNTECNVKELQFQLLLSFSYLPLILEMYDISQNPFFLYSVHRTSVQVSVPGPIALFFLQKKSYNEAFYC